MSIQFPSATETDERLASARHTVVRRVRRRRRVTAGATVGAVLLVAGSGVGATLVVQQLTAQEAASTVQCYVHADLGSFHGDAGMAVATASPGVAAAPPEAMDKAEVCALVWRGGLAVQAEGGHPVVDSYTGLGDYPVPPLAFCILANGATGGFPIELPSKTAAQVCERLGLPQDRAVPAS